MAKLGKQKFNLLGDHDAGRTTFAGTIELYLYYSTDGDFFYFDKEEMKKYFTEDIMTSFKENVFKDCDTKDKAVRVVELLISTKIKETRKLRIELGMNSSLYKIKNPKYKEKVAGTPMKDWSFEQETIIDTNLPEYLREILERGHMYSSHGLTLSFHRIMEVELNGIKRYASCDKNWKYKRSDLSHVNHNLIDWTPSAEQFLIDTQNRIDELCKIVLKFFNAGQDVAGLLKKMESNTKLLPTGD